jgi:hypothetical protein
MLRLRPQPTVLSGLGVAGAVLAAVVVTFALASGIIAFRVTTEEPLVSPSSALVLDPLRTGDLAAKPLVLRRAVRTAAGRRTAARGAAAPGASTRGGADASLSAPVGGLASAPGSQADDLGASSGPAETAQPGASAGASGGGSTLEVTTRALGATTGSLGRRLQGITGEVDTRSREGVNTILRRTAEAVAGLLSGRPQG